MHIYNSNPKVKTQLRHKTTKSMNMVLQEVTQPNESRIQIV